MKRTFARLAVVVCAVLELFFTGYAQAQQLSPGDKDKALQLLESTKRDVLDATRGLSEAQWNSGPLRIAGPLPNAWSTSPQPRIFSAV